MSITSRATFAQVKVLLAATIGPSDRSLLPFIPRPIKLLIACLFLLNWRSWPLIWHIRVLLPVAKMSVADFANRWRRRKWIEDIACVGADPFELVSTVHRYASLDDCDYNMHLSNSSYAKMVDTTRMKAATDIFGPILGEGTWIALAGSQYSFIREIPVGTHYEIRTTFGGWEDKWLYLIHTFVSYPKLKRVAGPTFNPAISTPATPSLLESPPQETIEQPKEPYKALANIPSSIIKKPLTEGADVNCIAVSLYCFKIGRITIPPSVFFIASGFGSPSKNRWARIQELRFSKSGNRLPGLLKGGWRTDVVEGWQKTSKEGGEWSSFWDLDEFEERRKERVSEIFGAFRGSLDALKALPA